MTKEPPLVQSRSNRWARFVGPGSEKDARLKGSITAIQVLLPEFSEEEIGEALEEHDGDPDAALEALLGGGPDVADSGRNEQVEEERALAAAVAVAAAAEEEEARTFASQPGLRPAAVAATATAALEPAPPAPEPEPEKPAAPAWLPMLQLVKPGQNGKRGMHDKRGDLLKAALGPSPASKVGYMPSSHDLDVKGKGNKGGGRGGS
eukprot:TRINITY_DN102556_c0_g1_i1.p1 TRINITY_DN102556_c0_g1~~TRINITY_DN102556_c0_g1_i1.p1  ORF type:complete len:206 (+),score=69.14 TRINITY_DN102556_c0_g1_i1:62-679(+)